MESEESSESSAILRQVVLFVRSGEESAMRLVYSIITELAPPDIRRLSTMGVADDLVRCIERSSPASDHPTIPIIAVAVADFLARKDTEMRAAVRRSGFFSSLFKILSNETSNNNLLKVVLDSLWNQTANGDRLLRPVLLSIPDLFPCVLRHLNSTSSIAGVRESACGVIANLCLDARCAASVIAANAVQIVAGLITGPPHPLRTRALSAMWNLCAHPSGIFAALSSRVPSAVLGLVRATTTGSVETEKASGCLGEMCLLQKEGRRACAELGALSVVVSRLTARHPPLTPKSRFSLLLSCAFLLLEDIADCDEKDKVTAKKILKDFCVQESPDGEFGWSWMIGEVSPLRLLFASKVHELRLFAVWALHHMLRPSLLAETHKIVLLSGVRGPLVPLTRSSCLYTRHHAAAVLALLATVTSPEETLRVETDTRVTLRPSAHTERNVSAAVCAARSEQFRVMFRSGMAESLRHEVLLEGTGVSSASWDNFLKFLYTDDIDVVTPTNAAELFLLADAYYVPRLRVFAEEILRAGMDPGNVLDVLFICDRAHGSDGLRKVCVQNVFKYREEAPELVVQLSEWCESDVMSEETKELWTQLRDSEQSIGTN